MQQREEDSAFMIHSSRRDLILETQVPSGQVSDRASEGADREVGA